MTDRVCSVPECTFPETGKCMHNYADPLECPDQISAAGALMRRTPDEVSNEAGLSDAVLPAPPTKVQLKRSGTLGRQEADSMMAAHYTTLVGIVGLPNAGKTACIASLYLLLANGSLERSRYADSATLMALEEITRGTRRWDGGTTPTAMTVRTELGDDRQPGYLHLRLRRDCNNRSVDLLLPDLPGEWTRRLMDQNEGDRFAFLRSADVIWVMVNGAEFLDAKTLGLAEHRTTLLIERLATLLGTSARLILVASWRDKGAFPEDVFFRIREDAMKHGLMIDLVSVASFSDSADVKPGFGIAELIDVTVSQPGKADLATWPDQPSTPSERAYLNFGLRT